MKHKFKKSMFVCLLAVLLITAAAAVLAAPLIINPVLYPQRYQETVGFYAEQYGLDENLIYAFIKTESSFNPQAESSVGARGLMQITEETFLWIKTKIAPNEEITFDDMYDPETNIRFGTYLVAASLQRYGGDVRTAAAAYHSGWGTVDTLLLDERYSADGKTLTDFPYTQMNLYTKKIQKNYEKYNQIYREVKNHE